MHLSALRSFLFKRHDRSRLSAGPVERTLQQWFVGGDERGLVTLLFTDIVGSSDVASELGDERWHRLRALHHAAIRKQLKLHGGHEVDTAGDGFFVTFTSPTRGVRCAFAIVREVRELGLDVRAGLHIGEVQLTGEKVGGSRSHRISRSEHSRVQARSWSPPRSRTSSSARGSPSRLSVDGSSRASQGVGNSSD